MKHLTFSRSWLAPAALGLFVLTPVSQALAEATSLEPVVVTANRTSLLDTEAPYATEIHGYEDIRNSGSTSLYDYLDRHTSVTVMPSFGNPFVQLIDMRGYGINDGYQNVVITVDGRRLNNLDMVPQLLSSIPLSSIERIEIVKGSGSVAQGDGATAGIINIVTRRQNGATLAVTAGSHGQAASNISAGLVREYFALNVTAENYRHDGFRKADTAGKKDKADADNLQAQLRVYPVEALELRVGKSSSWIETTYGGSITRAEFRDDPAQNGGKAYSGQVFESDTTSVGASLDLGHGLSVVLDHFIEDKSSVFASGWSSDYDYRSTDLSMAYEWQNLSLVAGWQAFDGTREGNDGDETIKDNSGLFLQGQYRWNDTSFAAGARREKVSYEYHPLAGSRLKDDHNLTAWDLGINHRLSPELTVFGNLNQGFQAPDVDRFFSTDYLPPDYDPVTSFNGFIKPAESRTLNLGVNHVTARNKLKATLFYVDLENEIYYYNNGGIRRNTNIDESHKYGLELQNQWQATDQLKVNFNYAWTRAVIDKEDEGNGAYNGKDLPGVSEHSVSIGLDYAVTDVSRVGLNQVWRSEAYAANDFANSFSQKQKAYTLTSLSYSHRLDQVELFARIDNLFDQANGLWVRDDAIYPVNFTRTWQVGVRANF